MSFRLVLLARSMLFALFGDKLLLGSLQQIFSRFRLSHVCTGLSLNWFRSKLIATWTLRAFASVEAVVDGAGPYRDGVIR